jgi:hypothetical protein
MNHLEVKRSEKWGVKYSEEKIFGEMCVIIIYL